MSFIAAQIIFLKNLHLVANWQKVAQSGNLKIHNNKIRLTLNLLPI